MTYLNNMIVKIKNYTWWVVASSRKSAVNIIKIENINFNDNIIFDFAWINVASHSFVDELIWVYVEKLWQVPKNIWFKNCNDYVKEQIKFVITERLNKKEFA